MPIRSPSDAAAMSFEQRSTLEGMNPETSDVTLSAA
jgi:hypothetical protein